VRYVPSPVETGVKVRRVERAGARQVLSKKAAPRRRVPAQKAGVKGATGTVKKPEKRGAR
jgi:hypothetical protein